MAILIPADENLPPREVQPGNGSTFGFAELYELLECDTVETCQLADGSIMVLDEESKCANKPRNARATRLADFATPAQLIATLLCRREEGGGVIRVDVAITDGTSEVDFIAGDALICGSEEWSRVRASYDASTG